ncbi:hypothetical protein FGG08_002285 [Glutinoglossum americanum]|uniref:Nephrocystin 3-like N-terminal domain-containing protein n=1 Tax=Glutinoglossum americanum TaxID=1670608 RepID=A0A9P8L5R1_9PEZI|nr:hypothetical protein FGG08_002285 [Glutinoglossum americanum]
MYNGSCDLHEPQTEEWLIHPLEYDGWLGGDEKFLWLYEIPGSGKAVLASFVIEEVKKFCSTSGFVGTGWAYYYFWYKREKGEAPQFLRWVINRLCGRSKYIPAKVHAIYNDGGEPTTSLMGALAAILERFQRVCLVLDAR